MSKNIPPTPQRLKSIFKRVENRKAGIDEEVYTGFSRWVSIYKV